MASAFVGVFPDRGGEVREGRQALAELAAVNSTAAIVPEGAPRVEAMLKFMLERNKDLVSAGVRRADGTLVVAVGNHADSWKPLANDHSTDRQLQVPILTRSEHWGQLELAFKSTGVPHLFGMRCRGCISPLHVRACLGRSTSTSRACCATSIRRRRCRGAYARRSTRSPKACS
jgi:hypothetical protein